MMVPFGNIVRCTRRKHYIRPNVRLFTVFDSAASLFERYGIYPRKQYTYFSHISAGNLLWQGKIAIEIDYGHGDYNFNIGIEQPGVIINSLCHLVICFLLFNLTFEYLILISMFVAHR